MNFHKGFSIYNIGFAAGIIGTFFIAVLRIFEVEVNSVAYIYNGSNVPFVFVLFSAAGNSKKLLKMFFGLQDIEGIED